ncbi:MAG: hypothetical protein V1720_15905 [bacterium]
MITFSNTWLPYLYLYGCGGLFFIAGMIIVRKSGAIDLRLKQNRFWTRVLIFGFIYFMAIHAILTIAALYW